MNRDNKANTLSFLIIAMGISGMTHAALQGQVLSAAQPVANAQVTLWKTNGKSAPSKLTDVKSDDQGQFSFTITEDTRSAKDVFYYTSVGGQVAGFDVPQLAYMAVVGQAVPEFVTLNEFTTVGSVWPNTQFIDKTRLSGNTLGLSIAAMNVPNLVNIKTGAWGDVLVDGINSWDSTTLAKFNTLSNLISLCGQKTKVSSCNKLLSLTNTSNNTLEAMAVIAKQPWVNTQQLFDLSQNAYPRPTPAARLSAPFVPYLDYVPDDFALSLRFAGGGNYAAGKLQIDKEGNIWSGQNWMPGSQSGVVKNIGGGTIKLAPNGKALSPAITGFTGMGVDGIGWGTAITKNNVWVASFAKTIGVMDFQGKALGPDTGYNLNGKAGMLQGVAAAKNGDVWVADSTNNQLLFFPEGDPSKGTPIKVPGLHSPFAIVIDNQQRVWVSNAQFNTVTMFPIADPNKAVQVNLGISVRGLALDSRGTVWAASCTNPNLPVPTIPQSAGIMDEFRIQFANLQKNTNMNVPTGFVSALTVENGNVKVQNFANQGIHVPWGISIDGQDNVWVGSFMGQSAVFMCGLNADNCPAGKKPGDLIHNFTNGMIQKVTDVAVDSAGNVWIANNWNNTDAVMGEHLLDPISTKGGGSGIVVIYGVAKPVATPVIGTVESLA